MKEEGFPATLTQAPDALKEAQGYLSQAITHHELNHRAEAVQACEIAEAIFQAQHHLEGLARCALLRADVYRTRGEYGVAHDWAWQAREKFKALGLTVEVARCDVALAYIYVGEQRFVEALDLLKSSRAVFVQNRLSLDAAWSDTVHGIANLDRGEYQAALKILLAARDTYLAEAAPTELRHCEYALANVYRRLGQCDQALEIYLRLRREYVKHSMSLEVAKCDMNIGLTYQEQNRYAEALEYFRLAAQTCLTAGLTVHAARCKTNMALAQEMLGAYDQALEAHQQAQETFAQAGLSLNAAHCEENMARIYLIARQPERALKLLLNAWNTFSEQGSPVLIADNHLLLAQAYQASGQLQQAQAVLEQARAAYAAEHMRGKEALCQLRQAEVLQASEESEAAAKLYTKARREFLERHWPVNVALCELGLGEVRLAQSALSEARDFFTSALTILEPDFPDWSWRAHHGLARACQRDQKEASALPHYLRAIDAIRRGRGGFHTAQGSSAFFAGRQHVYDKALSLSFNTHSLEHAIEIVEQGKAQAYLALLYNPINGLRPKQAQGTLGELFTREQVLQAQIESLQAKLAFPAADGVDEVPVESQAYQDFLDQLAQAQQAHAEIVARLFRARPLWAAATHPPAFALGTFRATLARHWPGPWGALIYYLSGVQLTILYLDDEAAIGESRILTPFELKLLNICTSSHPTRRGEIYGGPAGDHVRGLPGTGVTFLKQLYTLLIPKAAQARLSPEQLLIISPHGLLHALPFHALQSPDNQYLVQQSMISYTPSLHIFQLLLERNRAKEEGTALVIGVSEFGGRASPLPAAPIEAQAVHRLLGGSGRLGVNIDGQRAALLAMNEAGALRQYAILHFATHTLFEESAPLQSRLLLHDGDLTVPDLFDLDLDADLLTLSSCESARSEINVGDEMLGLVQAIFHAGARAVLAGLWKVPDATSGVWMMRFYQALRSGEPPAQALRTAQLQMIESGYTPFYWAPFILVGQPGRLKTNSEQIVGA